MDCRRDKKVVGVFVRFSCAASSLKSYEGGYKIMIIWMADKLNISFK
jgi:hypothetical protein